MQLLSGTYNKDIKELSYRKQIARVSCAHNTSRLESIYRPTS